MRRRLVWLLIVLFVAGFVTIALSPRGRWIIHGLWHGESFYKGLPTSYWREQAKEWADSEKTVDGGGFSGSGDAAPPPKLLDQIRERGNKALPTNPAPSPIGHHRKGIPVFLELLDDPDPDVRRYAAFALADIGQEAKVAVPRLAGLLRDGTPEVRRVAAIAILMIEKRGNVVVALLVELLKDPVSAIRQRVANGLGDFPEAAPALREALEDDDNDVREEAAAALKRIGEETGTRTDSFRSGKLSASPFLP
jgi:hypothetical protein